MFAANRAYSQYEISDRRGLVAKVLIFAADRRLNRSNLSRIRRFSLNLHQVSQVIQSVWTMDDDFAARRRQDMLCFKALEADGNPLARGTHEMRQV
ncbi:MAG TPA: hypothetical protein PLI12_03090, partial [Acetobacteraceae bacterium]|nr:hypothetical protein [Acetobacteraceae bacterium]